MGIEGFPQINKIQAQTLEEHENILERQFDTFQLEYINNLIHKKYPPLEESFVEKDSEDKDQIVKVDPDNLPVLLNRYSEINRKFVIAHKSQLRNSISERVEWTDDEYVKISKIYTDKILEFFKKNPNSWVNQTLDLLRSEEQKAENKFPKNLRTESERVYDVEKTGWLEYFAKDPRAEKIFSDTKFPYQKEQWYLSIHLQDLFKQKFDTKDKNIFSNESLIKLAETIVSKHPEVKAVFAQSWLMDTAVAERIGFKIYKREKYKPTPAFWGQFQDANGQMVPERMKKFIETGQAPYQVATGAIMVEDFLKKYLPKEYRGKPIILKDINPEFDHGQLEKEEESFGALLLNFENVSASDIQKVIDESIVLKEFNESDYGKGLFDLIMTVKKEGKTKDEIEKDERFVHYRESLGEFERTKKFINKEVVIE